MKWLKQLQSFVTSALLAIPIANFIRRGFDIPFSGYVAILFERYIKLRNSIFSILSDGFSFVSELLGNLDPSIMDILVIYLFGYGALFVTSKKQMELDRIEFESNPATLESKIKKSAMAHNLDPEKKWLEVMYGLKSSYFGWFRHFKAALRWPITLYRNTLQALSGVEGIKETGSSVTLNFLRNVLYSFCFIVFYLISGYFG